MQYGALFFIFCGIFNKAATEDTPQVTIIIQGSDAPNARWDQLIPALQSINNTTTHTQEDLRNIVKTFKNILTHETGNFESDFKQNKEYEDFKENVYNELSKDIINANSMKVMIKEDVNKKLNAMKEIIDGKHYMIDRDEIIKEISINNCSYFSKILNKLPAAVSKVKGNNYNTVTTEMISKPDSGVKVIEDTHETMNANGDVSENKLNYNSNTPEFTIPCQKASDILEETPHFEVPEEAICTTPVQKASDILEETPHFEVTKAVFSDLENMNFVTKSVKSILNNLPPGEIVLDSVSCKDTGDIIAIIFKPKSISLKQVYEDMMMEISFTILVPYHISKYTNSTKLN